MSTGKCADSLYAACIGARGIRLVSMTRHSPFLGGDTVSRVLVTGSLPVLTAVLDMLQKSLLHFQLDNAQHSCGV